MRYMLYVQFRKDRRYLHPQNQKAGPINEEEEWLQIRF